MYFCLMKKVFILVWIGMVTCIFSCSEGANSKGEPYNYVLPETDYILKVTNPAQLKTDLKANELLDTASNPIVAFISTSEILSAWKSQEPFYFSAIGEGASAQIVFTRVRDALNFSVDSIPNVVVEKSIEGKLLLQKITLNNDSLFTAIKDSVHIFSNNRASLISVLQQKEHSHDNALEKLLLLPEEGELIKNGMTYLYPETISAVNKLWTSQTIHLLPDGIQISGIVKSKDSTIIDVFKGQAPQESKIIELLPADFSTAIGFSFSDAALLLKNLKRHRNDTTLTAEHPLFETIMEVAEIKLKEGQALLMPSLDIAQSMSSLSSDLLEMETFRDVTIFESSLHKTITSSFTPLLSQDSFPYLFILDAFVVCTSSVTTAHDIISAFQNKNVLGKTTYYSILNAQLLSSSSLYVLGQGTEVSAISYALLDFNGVEKANSNYPLGVLQYSYDTSFAHLNFVTKEIVSSKQISGTVSQKFTTKLEQPILGVPKFFTNHRTRGQDVVVQDMSNTLHLFSISGKKSWSTKIDGAILGEINEIDILRNGKKQLAFATEKTFYILDRNGKAVAPFPMKFNDKITQPLAVFDYDNSRKYSFLITQGKEVYMYDSKGKMVQGFTFKKTSSPLVFPPKHIRLGSKDFIVLTEENGKATFLSRTGKERIKINETFDFSEIPIQKEGLSFVIIATDDKKHTISTSGKKSTQTLDISGGYYFKTLGKTKVTLDDNLLRINGVLVELPFGRYSEPQLINHNRNTYISVTDLQEKKVYAFGKNRKLVEGFPVYGAAEGRLASSGTKLLLVTKGSDSEILCYQVN
jgi:hypothetical protein